MRLRYAYFITCREVKKNAAGEVVELRCTYDPATKGGNAPDGRKVKGDHPLGVGGGFHCRPRCGSTIRCSHKPEPSGGENFTADLNPNSLEVLSTRRVEPALARRQSRRRRCSSSATAISASTSDSAPGRLVFNRTIGLRDTWAKEKAAG